MEEDKIPRGYKLFSKLFHSTILTTHHKKKQEKMSVCMCVCVCVCVHIYIIIMVKSFLIFDLSNIHFSV